jgi:hypothetical protein
LAALADGFATRLRPSESDSSVIGLVSCKD